VSDNLPSVTVIIAARPDQAEIQAVIAAQKLDYPADRLEILVARGKQPSVQRNAALKVARGDWIYFLDDDSVPPPGNLRLALKHFGDPQVRMVGGPNLCPPEAPLLEQIFATVLASLFAFWSSRARYTPVGKARPASEKELILCNLMARRDPVLALGGFNEKLYPNEENALMDELQQQGGKLIYDPEFQVYRRPRRTLKSFARMFMTYGRGRAEQFRVHPTFGSAINFAPPLFCLYLLALLILVVAQPGSVWVRWGIVPLGFYLLAILVQTVASLPVRGLFRSVAAMPWLAASHILYGLGFWRGLFTPLKPRERSSLPPIVLETIPH
jgi:glycosyltransferase involved in cell wall biosynthesis